MAMDENYLRKLLASGQITQEQLSQMPISVGVPNMLAQAMQSGGNQQYLPQQGNGMSMGGQDSALFNAAPGQGYQGLQSGQGVIQQTNEDGSQNAPIRIDSQPRQQMPERDMTRNAVDLPGGRGYYGKDGQVYNANGSLYLTPETQARNQAMSMAEQDRQMKIAKMRADLEHTNAQTASERHKLNAPEKAPPGYSWTQDGKLQAIAGGPADMRLGKDAMDRTDAATSALDSGALALKNIEDLIGKRDQTGALIEGGKAHPGFETAVGVSGIGGGFGLAGFIPGTDTTDFKTRLDQLKGGAFLQAFNQLKGGGAITEKEGEKATAAITRMNTAQSEREFVKAAQEYQQVIQQGMAKAAGKISNPLPTASARSQGTSSRVELDTMPMPAAYAGKILTTPEGMRYKSDGKNWVRQ